MAIARGTNNTGSSSTTTLTVTAPASIANGDLLLALIYVGTGTVTGPSGWTRLRSDAGGGLQLDVWWKIASSESGNYSWTVPTGGSGGIIVRYTGVDNTNPFESPSVSAGQHSASGTGPKAPDITTTVANDWVVHMFGAFNGSLTMTPGTDTEVTHISSSIVAMYFTDTTGPKSAGTQTGPTVTWSAATGGSGEQSVALNPAAGGGGGGLPFFMQSELLAGGMEQLSGAMA
jgi:hypothetical protein